MDTKASVKKLSESKKEELLKEILGNQYHTAGNNLPLLRKMIDRIGYVDNMFTLAELLPLFNRILSLRIFGLVSSGASILSIFLIPISSLINIVNAYQAGLRMYSYRAVAYTITAWAFNKPVQSCSQKILANIKTGWPKVQNNQIGDYHKAWKSASDDVTRKLDITARSNNIPKDALKAFLRIISENSEQKLCEMILKGFEKEFSFIELKSWQSNYFIRYPN